MNSYIVKVSLTEYGRAIRRSEVTAMQDARAAQWVLSVGDSQTAVISEPQLLPVSNRELARQAAEASAASSSPPSRAPASAMDSG